VASAALQAGDIVSEQLGLHDLSGNAIRSNVDTFFNRRCLFVMASTRTMLRRGRRVAIQAG
jgi:hypothetical protein